jgi:hypothetical protein
MPDRLLTRSSPSYRQPDGERVQQIARLWIHFASSPHPKASLLRVDIRDAAIAESGVATLDRVAVSDRKKGRGFK